MTRTPVTPTIDVADTFEADYLTGFERNHRASAAAGTAITAAHMRMFHHGALRHAEAAARARGESPWTSEQEQRRLYIKACGRMPHHHAQAPTRRGVT